MKALRYLLFSFIILSFNHLDAQFQISAELRPRFEANNGFNFTPAKTTETTFYVVQRSRLNLAFDHAKYGYFLSLQDARVWGDDNVASGTTALFNNSSSGIHQAWMRIRLNDNSFLKIGRQEFSYDDQRLLSARNWTTTGVTYDALLYHHQNMGWTFDLGLSWNNDATKGTAAGTGTNTFTVDPISRRLRTLNFIYLKKEIKTNWYLSATGLLTGYQKDKTTSTIYLAGTYGIHSYFSGGNIDSRINLFGQNGKNQKGKQLKAWMFTAEADYKLKKFKAGAGIDLLSGHDASNMDAGYLAADHSFDLFYGMRYAKYGLMNQYVVQSNTGNGGLIDIYPRIQFLPDQSNKISVDFHFFSLQQSIKNPLQADQYLSGSIGSELDVVWTHSFSKELNLHTGFGWYFTNETYASMREIETGSLGQPYFGWVMLTFKPVLFKTEATKK